MDEQHVETQDGAEQPKLEVVTDQPAEQQTEQSEVQQRVTDCAFVVYQDPEGRWIADGNLNVSYTTVREATINDFYTAACTIQKDVTTAETANQMLMMQQQLAQRAIAQAKAAQDAQMLGDLKDPAALKRLNLPFTK